MALPTRAAPETAGFVDLTSIGRDIRTPSVGKPDPIGGNEGRDRDHDAAEDELEQQ